MVLAYFYLLNNLRFKTGSKSSVLLIKGLVFEMSGLSIGYTRLMPA